MKQKTINIVGRDVTLAYCYATEICYKELSGQDITDFMPEVLEAIQHDRLPDVKKTIYMVLASILAYYQAKGEEPPVKDTDLMNEISPVELGTAFGTVLNLRQQFYQLPAGETEVVPDGSPSGKKKVRAKNS